MGEKAKVMREGDYPSDEIGVAGSVSEKDRMSGTTTKDDVTDLGVPMLPGDSSEPVGPEDALGPGPKRGDYSDRLGDSNYQPHEVRRNADGGVEVIAQAPRASQRGDEKGKKGGVDTTEGKDAGKVVASSDKPKEG